MQNIAGEEIFSASFIQAAEEDGVLTFGVCDSEQSPEEYFIIQFASQTDDQDKALGQDREYFEASCIDGGHYGVVREIVFGASSVRVRIEDDDGDARVIKAGFSCPDPRIKEAWAVVAAAVAECPGNVRVVAEFEK